MPRIMNTVYAISYGVMIRLIPTFPISYTCRGGNIAIAMKQPWVIWIYKLHEFTKNCLCNQNKSMQSKILCIAVCPLCSEKYYLSSSL